MPHDYSRQEVLEIVERQARERGIPRDDFLRFAYIETGGAFDERASRGPAGAKGLFQFIPSTAERYGIAGRELDPIANTDAAARLYLDNRRDVMASHTRTGQPYLSGKPEPDGLDMYMAHQQGAAGYRSVQAAIADGVFTRSDTRPHLLNNISRRDLEKVAGVTYDQFSNMSDRDMAQTFVAYWDKKFDRISIPEMRIEPIRGGVTPALSQAAPRASEADTQAEGHRKLTLSRAYELSVQHDDVRYHLGSKSAASGRVDCSGWIVTLQNATMNEINAQAGRAVFGRDNLFNPGMDAAATIIQKSAKRSGVLLEGGEVTRGALHEGMVIGEDNGSKSFDGGRFKGIDHITMVVREPKSGDLMISQARGGEGVEMVQLDRYLHSKQSHGVKLYSTDPLHKARAIIGERSGPAASHATNPTETSKLPVLRSTAPAADGVLRLGENGAEVRTLQIALDRLAYKGVHSQPLHPTGIFDQSTFAALKSFQLDHGLNGKGIYGPKTQAAMHEASTALVTAPTHPNHALYEHTLKKVCEAERSRGTPVGAHSERIAAALTTELIREGLTRVDRVEFNASNTLVRGAGEPHSRRGGP